MDKIDPDLLHLIEAHAAGTLPPDPENPDVLVHVYVAAENGDFGGLNAAGFETTSELGGTAIVTLPITAIESLADRADVVAIFAPHSGQPLDGPPPIKHTAEQRSMRLQEGYAVTSKNRPQGSKGEDVIIGIVDSGVNILHDAFTVTAVENGKTVRKTRILHYWAQGVTRTAGPTKLWERNGTLFTEAQINAHIAAFDANNATRPPKSLLDDEIEHGTSVLSVAGGSTWTAGPDATLSRTGVAPAARFIVVGGQRDDIAGIEFCFDKAGALERPCVVNMSLGDHDRPHNGLTLFARRLRALLRRGSPPTFRPGRAFVIAAGNEGSRHNHMRFALTQPKTLEIEVGKAEFELGSLISSTTAGLKVSLAAPGASPTFSPQGPRAAGMSLPGHTLSIRTLPSAPQQNPDDLPADPHFHVKVIASNAGLGFIKTGTWQLTLDPGATPHPEVHVWLYWGTKHDTQKLTDPTFGFGWAMEDDEEGMQPRWRREKEWIHSTLSSDACCVDPIATGATFLTPTENAMSPIRLSSRGPATEAGRPPADQKPDIVAPGFQVVTARWRAPRAGSATSISTRASGTSVAAPAVTGAAALMLSHDPSLTQADIRTILRATTSPWAPKVRKERFVDLEMNEQNIAGSGFIDIEAALKRVKARLGP